MRALLPQNAMLRLKALRSRWLSLLIIECGIAQCRRFHLSHRLLINLPGVFLDKQWFCSPACLGDAVRARMLAERSAGPAAVRRLPRMPYRLILLARGVVTEGQLSEARTMHGEALARGQAALSDGVRPAPPPTRTVAPGSETDGIGEALVLLGYATEEQVAGARAAEAGCGFYSGESQPVSSAQRIPAAIMRRYQVVPVHTAGKSLNDSANRIVDGEGRLLLGFVHRVDHGVVQAASRVTGFRVEACMITPTAYRRQLERLEAGTALGEADGIELDVEAGVPERVADLMVNLAVESRADRVRVARIGDALWIRLDGKSLALDLVVDLMNVGLIKKDARLGRGIRSRGADGYALGEVRRPRGAWPKAPKSAASR